MLKGWVHCRCLLLQAPQSLFARRQMRSWAVVGGGVGVGGGGVGGDDDDEEDNDDDNDNGVGNFTSLTHLKVCFRWNGRWLLVSR